MAAYRLHASWRCDDISELHTLAAPSLNVRTHTLTHKIESRLINLNAGGIARAGRCAARLCAAADESLRTLPPAAPHADYPGCCLAASLLTRAAFSR